MENDKPDVYYPDGYKAWLNNRVYHRENGPAVIYPDKSVAWYLNGTFYYAPEDMPLSLYLAYLKWELKKHGK